MREVTESPWFKDVVAQANGVPGWPSVDLAVPAGVLGPPALPSQDPAYIPFVFRVEQYQDAMGNDNK